jgi:hypothetical protein
MVLPPEMWVTYKPLKTDYLTAPMCLQSRTNYLTTPIYKLDLNSLLLFLQLLGVYMPQLYTSSLQLLGIYMPQLYKDLNHDQD